MKNDTFVFDSYEFDAASGIARFRYAYENGPSFEETIAFPRPEYVNTDDALAVVDQAVRLLYLVAGVSYYKFHAPEELACKAFDLDAATASFVRKIYYKGLGEFAFKNKLDLRNRINFLGATADPPQARVLKLPDQLLIPVGGGKDSIVTIETLKKLALPITLFALGPASAMPIPIKATIENAQLPFIYVERKISSNLIRLNRTGQGYNGHIPITAIVSAVAIVCALLNGISGIVFSNEHSASSPNVTLNDLEVNHQYSKSFEFECDFAAHLRSHISPSLSYFSLLRPLNEIAIASKFAEMRKYHSTFRSCNAAFRQDTAARSKRWCCDCPKCRFVFIALAPFIPKRDLVEIFGANILNDATQLNGYAELAGITAHKPFECVGEVEEVALLLRRLSQMPQWSEDRIVRELAPRLPQGDSDSKFEIGYRDLFELKRNHRVTARYLELLDARI